MKAVNEDAWKEAKKISKRWARDGFELVGLHEYCLPSGEAVYWRIRLKNIETRQKKIFPMIKNGRSFELCEPEWPPSGKLLYGLDSLGKFSDPVLIVEGETNVDYAHSFGIAAVTSGGCSSAAAADWKPVHGRRCVIWRDNDKPGMKYANEVQDAISKFCPIVELVDVSSLGLSEAEDCIDWGRNHPEASAAEILSLPRITPNFNSSRIEAALLVLATDVGPLFDSKTLAELKALHTTDVAAYMRVRQKVAQSKQGIVQSFDKLTSVECDEGHTDREAELLFAEVLPSPNEVDGEVLLSDLEAYIRQFVIADDHTVTLAALWAMHTYRMDVWSISPIANIRAPEKRCGKSILLTALNNLCFRPLLIANITTAALFRCVDKYAPTLLIDEVDAWLSNSPDLRNILNSGLYKHTATVVRCVGEEQETKVFSSWAPKVLCGIGQLADTLDDRSIHLTLRRKVEGEHVDNIRHVDPGIAEGLRSRILRWSNDHKDNLAAARPNRITGLHDRASDSMEPLLAIATEISPQVADRVRQLAIKSFGMAKESTGIGEQLLGDIQRLCMADVSVRTEDLILRLTSDEDLPWARWNRGRPMSARQLAERLKHFDIRPTTIRFPSKAGDVLKKGYYLADFAESFNRYLSVAQRAPAVTALQLEPVQTADQQGLSANSPPARKHLRRNAVTEERGEASNRHKGVPSVSPPRTRTRARANVKAKRRAGK
jgi:hypothetical protein